MCLWFLILTALLLPCASSLALKKHGTKNVRDTVRDIHHHQQQHHQHHCADTANVNISRRNALMLGGSIGSSTFLFPPVAVAANDEQQNQLKLSDLLTSLQKVPTFCIVNSKNGAAYMLYKPGEGFAKGYAFFDYSGAQAVLTNAQETAEKGGYGDVWKDATLTSIPADIAARLTLAPRQRTSQKDTTPGATSTSILSFVPSEKERNSAMKMEKSFKEQGKCPVFYLSEFRDDNGKQLLYFNAKTLIEDWNKQSGVENGESNAERKIPPRIQVLDLVTIFQYVLRGRASELPFSTNGAVFVPEAEALKKAADLKAAGMATYNTERMIV